MGDITALRADRLSKVTVVGMLANILLSAGKMAAGLIGRSSAMTADAVHSISDLATDAVVLMFVRISSKPRDRSHDYGHGKFETLASVLVGAALIPVAVLILRRAVLSVTAILSGEIPDAPRAIALWAAVISILVKELLFRYTVAAADAYGSQALKANAWHHRSDALSSVASLAGIAGAMFLGEKWRIADPVSAAAVSAMILTVAVRLCRAGISELLEESLDDETESEIDSIIRSVPMVCEPHDLRTRKIGSSIAVEFHIRLAADMTVAESHRITETLENRLKERFGEDTHITVHVEPD